MDITVNWGWPHWTMLILLLLKLLLVMARHGEPHAGKHNAFLGAFGFGLTMFILISGGFFP